MRGRAQVWAGGAEPPSGPGDAPGDAGGQRRSPPALPYRCRLLIFLMIFFLIGKSKTNPALFVVSPAVIPQRVK